MAADTTTKRGGAGKWLIGTAVAAAVVGGSYFAFSTFGAYQPDIEPVETAYNDPAPTIEPYDETQDEAETTAVESAPPPQRPTPQNAIPEAVIGVVPLDANSAASVEAVTQSDDIVVPAPRHPIWARTPSARRLSALYPQRALDRGREGEASLHCTVQDGGVLDCERASESSSGFGAAALRIVRLYRHAATLPDGSTAVGTPLNVRVVFRIADDGRRGRR